MNERRRRRSKKEKERKRGQVTPVKDGPVNLVLTVTSRQVHQAMRHVNCLQR